MTRPASTYDDTATGGVRSAFEHALMCALTEGRLPGRSCALGANTWAAIEAIARNHPEAATELINDAYDSFRTEYGAVG